MKKMKKMIALMLALVLCLSMTGMSAFATEPDPVDPPPAEEEEQEEPSYDAPLTVTGLKTGDVAHFYQVIEWVGEAAGNVAGWKAKAPFATYLTEAKLREILVGTPVEDDPDTPEDESEDSVPPTGITSEIAGEIAKLASGAGTEVEESSGTATLENAAAGMWMALIDPADANTVYNPVFVSADYNKDEGGTVAVTDTFKDSVAKSSTLTLEKEAEDETSVDNDFEHTTAVGDTLDFTVSTTIPAYGFVYDTPHFAVKDTLTALELDAESVEVTTPEGLTKGKEYTVSATTSGYTLTFAPEYLTTLKTATEVVIEYKAVVTSDAANAVNEENNDVYIEYSHNPNDQSDYDVKKDTTQHYTFSLDAEGIGKDVIEELKGKKTSEIVKIGLDAAGKPITETKTTSEIGDPTVDYVEGPLAGAVFGLFTDSKCETPYKDKDGNDVTAESGTDGRMNFKGLDAGTYYIQEISAPAGYVTNSKIYTVEIVAETETVTVTEWWNGTAWVDTKPTSGTAKEVTYETDILKSYTVTIDGKETAKYTFTNNKEPHSTQIQWEEAELIEHPFPFDNTKGTELPSTGGVGTTMFYVIGSVLVLGAAVLLISKRRMNAR